MRRGGPTRGRSTGPPHWTALGMIRHGATMNAYSELEVLALDVANGVAGHGAVDQVEVVQGEDSLDRPAYFFTFLLDERQSRMRVGLIRTRLIQRLRAELFARGDEHFPVIRLLDHADWEKR